MTRGKTLSYYEVRNFIEVESDSGCKLLSKEYKNSSTPLKIQCKCDNVFEMHFKGFKQTKYKMCINCVKLTNNKLTSFRYKISKKEFQDKLDRKFDYQYEVVEFSDMKSYATIKHKHCNNLSTSLPYNILKWKGDGCPICTGRFKLTTNQFKERVYNLVNNEYKVIGEYKNMGTPIEIIHNSCGHIWDVYPGHFLNKNSRCPKCAGFNKTPDDFVNQVNILTNNNYEVHDKYINAITKIRFKHLKCGNVFEMVPNNFLNGQRCPRCASSKGEKEIANILDEIGVEYIQEYTFDDCKNINTLPFDFYLSKHNLLIEYDGEQHFKPIDFAGRGEEWALENYQDVVERDNIKNQYCKDNNIPLLRIPYWDNSNIHKILEEFIC